jgi:LytS/YehU family sensor histidine kinase
MKYDIFAFLDDLGLVWKYAINGFIGGLIWSMYKKSKFWEAFRQIIIGGIVSGYFTPVIVAKTNMDLSFVGFTSFVIGMLGMVIVDSLYKYLVKLIKKWKDAIVIINQKSK